MQPKLIVCESTSRWAPAIRRATFGIRLPLIETRSLRACGEELAARPYSIAAIETSPANLAVVVEMIDRWRRDAIGLRILALASTPLDHASDLLLDAGASYVIESPLKLAPLLRIVERHLRPRPRAEVATLEARLAAELPWGRGMDLG